ncbi:hypothetical protein [Frankia sp. AiPs1]|uniref:hypothetical protein n=1 Tax=Frankia sp. AiPs1 TaxID=573493 RepID=UPI0035ABF452
MAFSPDGSLLVSCSTDQTVRVWDLDTGTTVAVLGDHSSWARGCVFSPDGSLVASASEDTTVRLWNTDGATTRTVLRGHDGPRIMVQVHHVGAVFGGAGEVEADDGGFGGRRPGLPADLPRGTVRGP